MTAVLDKLATLTAIALERDAPTGSRGAVGLGFAWLRLTGANARAADHPSYRDSFNTVHQSEFCNK